MKSKILSSALLVVGFLIGATALSTLAAWTAPTQTPPNCTAGSPGCDAPLHVGAGLQTKLGQLSLNSSGTGTYGLEVVNGIKLIDAGMLGGAVPTGKVLTADANGVGTWQSMGSAVSGMTVYTDSNFQDNQPESYTWTVPAGAKFAKVSVVGSAGYYRGSGTQAAYTPTTYGGVAVKVIPLSGANQATISVFTEGTYSFTFGSTVISATSAAMNSTANGVGTGGTLNTIGPYMGFGNVLGAGNTNTPYPRYGYATTAGAVIIEWY